MSVCGLNKKSRVYDAIEFYFIENPSEINLSNIEKEVGNQIGESNFKLSPFLDALKEDNIKKDIELLFEAFEVNLQELLDNKTIVLNSKSNVINNFSSVDIIELFHTLPMAKNYFENSTQTQIIKALLLGNNKDETYVQTDAQFSNKVYDLKKNLFKTIVTFLKSKNKLSPDVTYELYTENNLVNYDVYKKVLNTLERYFFSGDTFKLLETYSGKRIPNLTADISTNVTLYNVYNAGILLVNFDTVLQKYFGDLIDMDYRKMNSLDDPIGGKTDRYKIRIEGLKTIYWNKDEHESEGSEHMEDKLTKLLIAAIPSYNKRGELTLGTMEMKDFYLLSSKISNFEMEHGNRLKRIPNSGFDYFNNNSVERLE